jgi:lipoprotein-anchoring transpeptidase ErfK/SrfK
MKNILSLCILLFSGLSLPAQQSAARELVTLEDTYPLGSIVVDTSERRLYYSLGHNVALRYPVAVGKVGMQWSGQTFVQSKAANPGWTPTPAMRRRSPYLPRHVRGK